MPETIRQLPAALLPNQPLTALAPMQDVTDLPFMRVTAHYGAPDYFFTEFFRVHGQSRPEKHILRSIVENQTGRPVFAQLIGESIPDMVRTVKDLLQYPVAGIDLNMGCPAPKIYKKNVGGGLLRDPAKVDAAFWAVESITGVKVVCKDYRVRSASLGRDALGEVQLEVEYKGHTIKGVGVSTDTVEATLLAILNAINRIGSSGDNIPQRVSPTN